MSRYDAWLTEELEDAEPAPADDVELDDCVDDDAGDIEADRYFGDAA